MPKVWGDIYMPSVWGDRYMPSVWGERYMPRLWGGHYNRTQSFLNPVVCLTRRLTNLKCSNGNCGHGRCLQFQIATHYWMTRLF